MPLFWALFESYKWPVLLTLLLSTLSSVLWTANVHILREIMIYLEGESDNQSRAITFALLMIVIEMVSRVSEKLISILQATVSNNISSSVKGLLYSKAYTGSSATNKKYGKGELINLINSDASTITMMAWLASELVCVPLELAVTSYTLYCFIGHVYWYALIVTVVSFIINYYSGIWVDKFYEKFRKHSDSKYNCLSEIIDNIRVIKMNSWIN